MKNIFRSSFAKIFLIFAALNFILRLIFLVWERKEIDFSPLLLAKISFVGVFFDFITICYIATPALIYYICAPTKFFNSSKHQKVNKVSYFLFLYIITFSCFSEITFWQEFQTRFNFIAVDYLIYTTEVINNIVESYPMGLLLAAILTISGLIFYFTRKKIVIVKQENFSARIKAGAVIPLITLVAFLTIDSSKLTKVSENNYANEITANGIYQLFSAYRNNKINYGQLYSTIDQDQALQALRADIARQEPHSKFLNQDDIERQISSFGAGGEKKYNVIFVSIESFSADFMQHFGNAENITPNMDKIANEGLFFTGMKATGTRTVRGLEALTLSVPPTPGNSIVRRSGNENLFNVATPLKQRGYDARFVYGGYGYFDNMNYFYENNGFEIVDRAKFSKEEITFENAWGVSDEDLFDKTIKEADKSFAAKKPFFNFVMTTSNHRPFTYPDGKIDIASKTGRNGSVKYTDYAIGQLLEKARSKKWFDNTIFVFVADHCAGSAGNTDVPLWRYQIPAIFYAPKIIAPKVFAKNVSQIDVAPTLLGILNLSYQSKFFGHDVIHNEKTLANRSFVSTYTDVGYFKNDKLFLLKPKKETKVFAVRLEKYGWNGSTEKITTEYDQEELKKAISYYQGASAFFENGNMKNYSIKEGGI